MTENLPILQALPSAQEGEPLSYDEAKSIYQQKWKDRRDVYHRQLAALASLSEAVTGTSQTQTPQQIRATNRRVQDYAAEARKLARLSQEAMDAIDRYVEHVRRDP